MSEFLVVDSRAVTTSFASRFYGLVSTVQSQTHQRPSSSMRAHLSSSIGPSTSILQTSSSKITSKAASVRTCTTYCPFCFPIFFGPALLLLHIVWVNDYHLCFWPPLATSENCFGTHWFLHPRHLPFLRNLLQPVRARFPAKGGPWCRSSWFPDCQLC